MIQDSSKKGSKVVSYKDEITIFKNNRGSNFDNFDVLVIAEWLSKNTNEEKLYSSLRAIALMCAVVEGFEEVFFKVANALPNNLPIKNLFEKSVI